MRIKKPIVIKPNRNGITTLAMLKIGISLENTIINTFRIERLTIQKWCAKFDDAEKNPNFHLRMKDSRRVKKIFLNRNFVENLVDRVKMIDSIGNFKLKSVVRHPREMFVVPNGFIETKWDEIRFLFLLKAHISAENCTITMCC